MNEAETRAEHIDPALAAAGWGVVDGSRIRRVYPTTLGRIEGHGRRGKSLTADYVLEYRNTKLARVTANSIRQCFLQQFNCLFESYPGELYESRDHVPVFLCPVCNGKFSAQSKRRSRWACAEESIRWFGMPPRRRARP